MELTSQSKDEKAMLYASKLPQGIFGPQHIEVERPMLINKFRGFF